MNENHQEPTLEELQAFANEQLAQYKKLKKTLINAYNGYEEELIEEKLEAYRKVIKSAKAKIREMLADDEVLV
ncbi:MAG: hypothetical protein JXQ76_09010 [Campylobacterales bacterium]|nr:hypothetical protein [Campylobacterales bacterium]